MNKKTHNNIYNNNDSKTQMISVKRKYFSLLEFLVALILFNKMMKGERARAQLLEIMPITEVIYRKHFLMNSSLVFHYEPLKWYDSRILIESKELKTRESDCLNSMLSQSAEERQSPYPDFRPRFSLTSFISIQTLLFNCLNI